MAMGGKFSGMTDNRGEIPDNASRPCGNTQAGRLVNFSQFNANAGQWRRARMRAGIATGSTKGTLYLFGNGYEVVLRTQFRTTSFRRIRP